MISLVIPFIISILVNTVPIAIWLWVWQLKENKKNTDLSIYFFLFGMVIVFLAFLIEHFLNKNLPHYSVLALFTWAFTEELLKILLVLVLWRLRKIKVDEIFYYGGLSALGFAFFENVFFVLKPIVYGTSEAVITTALQRFVGAVPLHLLCTGVVLSFMAYYHRVMFHKIIGFFALFLASVLHTIFNDVIITTDVGITTTFLYVWAGIVLLFTYKLTRETPTLSSLDVPLKM